MASSQDKSDDDPARMSLEDLRTDSYNRIIIPGDLKSQICSQIADSNESLPLWGAQKYDGSYDNPEKDPKVADTSDVATPMPKDNPMEGVALDKQKTAIPLSNVSTAQSVGSDGKENGRPSTFRRLTTKIKRTMSSTQSKQ